MKYLVQQKRFTAENNTQEKKKDLENIKKTITEFEGRISTKIR